MIFGKYHFYCRLLHDAMLPPYKGSTFRGVFGRALKKVVCALKQKECKDCLLKEKCVYALAFETSIALPLADGARISSPPHPYVIEPPLNFETNFKKESVFDFHLLLFGNANNSLPYFIYAFDQMGKIGIGKKIAGRRARFELEQVKTGGHIIYNNNDRKITIDDPPEILTLSDPENYPDESVRLQIILETPLRLKFENHLKADLPFHVFIRAILRRISSLCICYGQGEPDLDYRGLVKKAKDVKTGKSELEWFDWRRYSFRQDQSMLMGGMTGSALYEGKIAEFMPLIDFCQKVHIGKQTSFGLGKFNARLE